MTEWVEFPVNASCQQNMQPDSIFHLIEKWNSFYEPKPNYEFLCRMIESVFHQRQLN